MTEMQIKPDQVEGTAATQAEVNAVGTAMLTKALINAKGDLIVGESDDTPMRVGVGANGTLLVADATQTPGVKWSASEAWREVGTAGNPGFLNNWGNNDGVRTSCAFFKDLVGVVHLKGVVKQSNGTAGQSAIFQLPAGYRPAKEGWYPVLKQGVLMRLEVQAGGNVNVPDAIPVNNWVTLDGVSFRADQ
jgi:hypothetical protein